MLCFSLGSEIEGVMLLSRLAKESVMLLSGLGNRRCYASLWARSSRVLRFFLGSEIEDVMGYSNRF